MSYSILDFTESLDRCQIKTEDIKRVAAAWGETGCFAEWSGGFLMEMKDGRWGYIEGWCDTTGWGCQDGAEVKWLDSEPKPDALRTETPNTLFTKPHSVEWETDPTDCARYLAGEIDRFDRSTI